MAKVIIDSTTYEFNGIFDGVESITFKDDGGIPSIIIENSNPIAPDYKYFRINLTSNGGITRERSADGENWTWEENHADTWTFGSVKPSDSYTATGAGNDGLVPSQYALYTGLATKVNKSDISDSYSATGTAANGKVPSQKALSDSLKVSSTQTLTKSGKSFYFKKVGNVIYVESGSGSVTWASGSNSIGTLPAGFRPANDIYLANAFPSNPTTYMRIATSGAVTVTSSRAEGSDDRWSGSYIANS